MHSASITENIVFVLFKYHKRKGKKVKSISCLSGANATSAKCLKAAVDVLSMKMAFNTHINSHDETRLSS